MFLCLNENHPKMPNEKYLIAKTSVYTSDVEASYCGRQMITIAVVCISQVFFTSCWILDQCALHIASARMLYCTHRAVGKSKDPGEMSSNVVDKIWPPQIEKG